VYKIPAAVRQCARLRPEIEPPIMRTWKPEFGFVEGRMWEGDGIGSGIGGVAIFQIGIGSGLMTFFFFLRALTGRQARREENG
jgi:hypothetical protein